MFDLIPWSNREKNMFGYLDNLEKAFFQNAFSGAGQMKTDIVDSGDKFVLSADLPGYNREDIKIDVQEGYLTIRAEKKEELEENRDSYIRRERRYGSFARSFDVSGIDTDRISARYENGVLSLDLPKRDPEPLPPSRQIDIH